MNAPSPLDRVEASQIAPIASLAMYDWPQLQAANDRLWAAIVDRLAASGVEAPRRLTRDADLMSVWTSPSLLLGQTCGYPLTTSLGGRVRVLATPRYRAPGCEGPFRRSAIVVAADAPIQHLFQLRDSRCALNDRNSDSGMNLLRAAVAPLAAGAAFFSQVIVTGSHLASAEAVAGGTADVAALDAVTYAHLRRLRPDLAQLLRPLQWTQRTPGLPLITAANTDPTTVEALQGALADIARDPDLAEARATLLLEGFTSLPSYYYQALLQLEAQARARGYPELA